MTYTKLAARDQGPIANTSTALITFPTNQIAPPLSFPDDV